MFFKKSNATTHDLDTPNTVIGKGMYLESARLSGHESVRIDGIYKGQIDIEGSLVLGDEGSVTGDIRANYFLVAGEVVGNIYCTSQLHFASTAKVFGDVQSPSLIVDEGAQVSGKYTITKPNEISESTSTLANMQEERPRLIDNKESNVTDEQTMWTD
ncbi:MAG: polymer-forming cytoskeletal protein [Defluviitaleaceae bacterium]|nr:polymer-forming cytoskeletal protein [Defluviitaleaceae bacterium]